VPEIPFKFVGKPDNLNVILDPDEIKAIFDNNPEEVRKAVIALTNALESVVDGASGADNLGVTPIPVIGEQSSVQSVIEALIARLQATTSASGAKFTGAEEIVGLTGNDVQTLLSALKALVDAHKNSSDHDGRYFTETEMKSTTDGVSGADKIGATKIATSPENVQGILEWLKAQIDAIVSSGIADDSVTDVKLSNTAGQIKDVVTRHLVEDATDAHLPINVGLGNVLNEEQIPASEKGSSNGVATLNEIGSVPVSQLGLAITGLSIKAGIISNGGTIPKTTGYTNYMYLVSLSDAYTNIYTNSIYKISLSVDQSTRIVSAECLDNNNLPGTISVRYYELAWK